MARRPGTWGFALATGPHMRAGEQGHDPPATDVKGAPKRTKHRHPLNKHPGPRAPAAEKWSQVALARVYLTRAACLSADVMEFMWSKGRPPQWPWHRPSQLSQEARRHRQLGDARNEIEPLRPQKSHLSIPSRATTAMKCRCWCCCTLSALCGRPSPSVPPRPCFEN